MNLYAVLLAGLQIVGVALVVAPRDDVGRNRAAVVALKFRRDVVPAWRVHERNPRLISRCMSLLYEVNTLWLSACGQGVGESHQMCSTESLILIRRTFTHSAGAGSFAGLYQKHSCAR